jgi:hypothetical protein
VVYYKSTALGAEVADCLLVAASVDIFYAHNEPVVKEEIKVDVWGWEGFK